MAYKKLQIWGIYTFYKWTNLRIKYLKIPFSIFLDIDLLWVEYGCSDWGQLHICIKPILDGNFLSVWTYDMLLGPVAKKNITYKKKKETSLDGEKAAAIT